MDWGFGVGGAVFLHTVSHPPFVEGCRISEAPIDVVRMDMSLAFVDDFVHEIVGSCSDAGISEGVQFYPFSAICCGDEWTATDKGDGVMQGVARKEVAYAY